MAFTNEELTTWVKGLGLSEDEQKSVLASMGKPEVLAKVGGSILAQQEFSRKMDDLAKEKQKLETDYQNDRKTLVDWKTGKEKVLSETVAAKEKAERQLAAHNDKIKALAQEYSISEDKVKELLADAPTDPDKNRQDDRQRDFDGRYVKTEDFKRAAQDVVKVPAILMAIQAEHQQLFGSNGPQCDMVKLVEDAQTNKKTLRQQWETEFKVPEQRQRVADDRLKSQLADAEKRGAEQERSRLLTENPNLNQNIRSINANGSPILELARRQTAEAAKHVDKNAPVEVDEHRGVAAAVAAFNQGKYDQGARKQS